MWFRSLIDSLTRRNRRRTTKPKQTARCLFLEGLEDRCLMAVYAVTDLGTLGGYYSTATDLNEAGQVVGYSAADGYSHAFLWQNVAMVDLGTLGGSDSYAEGINDLGQVVGTSALPGDEFMHAFLLTPQGGVWFQDSDLDGRNDFMMDLGTFGGSAYAQAFDINNAGQVVGDSGGCGFLWESATGMVDLGSGYATGINENGQVTISGYDFVSGYNSAFLWHGGNGTTLGAGPGYTDSQSAAINEAGQVAGYQWDASAQIYHAMLWTPDSPNGATGGFTDLDTLGFELGSNATAINNSGQVVGSITVDIGGGAADSFYEPRAFLWEAAASGPTLLQNQLLPGTSVILEYAHGINDGGAIAVNGLNGSGNHHAYLLTPVPQGTPSISIADASAVTEGNAGTLAAIFTVTLSVASSQPVTVAYVTANGSAISGNDYQAASGTLTIPPGQTTGKITVLVNGDRVAEANENFYVNLSIPTDAAIADGQGVATILDNEPRISITDVSKKEGKKNQTTLFTFTVTLSTAYDQPVTMSYHTVDGTAATSDGDYVSKTDVLTFAPGEMTKTITIEVKGENKKEASETFYLDLFGNSNNSIFTKNRGIGTILNDD